MPIRRTTRPESSPCRTAIACLLILNLSSPALLLGQMPQAPQAPAQSQQQPPMQPTQPSGQANEATSKPIDDTPVAPMAAIQATLPQQASSPLTRDEQILEILNRFTYGPRPGDVERIRAIGVSKWFTIQFNPWQIDDSALDRKLADYPAMKLPIGKLMELYPNQQMIRAAMNGRGAGAPGGEGEKQLYKTQEERYKEKKNGQEKDAADSDPAPLPWDVPTLLAMSPSDRFNALTKITPQQLNMLRRNLAPDDRQKLTDGFTPHEIEVLAAFNGPAGVVSGELVQTKILRDIYSERQLNEVMTDFWLNHFNVYMKKSQQAPYFITSYERDVIRPRALGHFESLLVATAMSPAMLNYLDNASSIGAHSQAASPMPRYGGRFGRQQPQQQQKASGLNENYARELMELHTVGVNGGYTQKDVTEVAKVFTGWTLGTGFGGGPAIRPEFDESKHEPGDKFVLGVKIKQDGPEEGMKVLHMLATSPQTAHFISTKLAVRFVSDDPPPAMVERMAQTFLRTGGDIRQVLLAMIQSPEFFTRDTYRAKVKTPQDYVISAVRASGADVQSAGALAAAIAELGQPLYGMQTPNGYSMKADPWNSTSALVSRMNFALALSSNRVAGVHADLPALVASPAAADAPEAASLSPDAKDRLLEDRILHMSVSDRTRAAIMQQINAPADQQQSSLRQIGAKNARDPLATLRTPMTRPQGPSIDPQIALAAGLIFGSPEFQRR
jgi:uncharacterized protein (DUF1800 family)